MLVHSERIELTDSNNVVRIRLGVDSKNSAYLSLNGVDGRERIVLSVDDEGNGSIGFRAVNGQPTITIGMSSESMGITILDITNENHLVIESNKNRGGIRMETREGVKTWPS